MFLFNGNSSRAEIVALLGLNLREICTLATPRRPNVYWLTNDGGETYERRVARRTRRRDARA